VTMYQMLTGTLPYDTPAPSDLERLKRGELVEPLRVRAPQTPPVIEHIVMRALAGDVGARYQRAEDLLSDILNARKEVVRRPPVAAPAQAATVPRPTTPRSVTPARIRTREVSAGRFCWNCRKPLPVRSSRCPFCGETQ
jgi:hypothetical protein